MGRSPASSPQTRTIWCCAPRAACALAGIKAGAAITLTKHLPIASGIGGGSGGPAETIKELLLHWKVKPDLDRIFDLALTLGADVPVCFYGDPAVMSGIGEKIRFAGGIARAHMVLVNPLVAT